MMKRFANQQVKRLVSSIHRLSVAKAYIYVIKLCKKIESDNKSTLLDVTNSKNGKKMKEWAIPTLLAVIFWGIWGFFPKLTVQYIRPLSAILFEIVGATMVALVILFLLDFKLDFHPKGAIFATSTGVFGILGALCFLMAVSKGKLSVVVTVTALYPIVTLTLAALILKQPISVTEALGILLALIAIVLLSMSSR